MIILVLNPKDLSVKFGFHLDQVYHVVKWLSIKKFKTTNWFISGFFLQLAFSYNGFNLRGMSQDLPFTR